MGILKPGVQPDLRQLALRHQHQLGQLRTRVEPIPSRHHGFPYENGLRNLDDLGVPIFGNLEIYGNHWFEGKNYTTLQHNFFPQKNGAFSCFLF
jgi:hypothetical protein